MIYCNFKGGLGNMLFQMAATIEIARINNTGFSFPNLLNHLHVLRNDEFHNPNLKNVDHYAKFFGHFNHALPNKPLPIVNFPYHYVDIKVPDDCIINGFFQSEKYFIKSRKTILDLFPKNDTIDKISIHIRRGDYLKKPGYHNILNMEYFYKAIEMFPNEKFVIFSDDIGWCKHNFKGERFSFVEKENDLQQIIMMSACKHNIISNSSFSWWGAWNNRNEDKIIVAPNKWVGEKLSHLKTDDVQCEEWVKIEI